MAVLTLTIEVPDITAQLAVPFDKIKVYRSDTEDGTFVEITSASTRPTLSAGVTVYEYVDYGGNPLKFYKYSFFDSVGGSNESSQMSIVPLYISVQDMRDEGFTTATASDQRVVNLIKIWSEFIDRQTRNFFLPRSETRDVDGNGTKILWFQNPIVSVSELYINDQFSALVDTDQYHVYVEKRNSRIKLQSDEVSIFVGTGSLRRDTTIFEVGEVNQRVVGVFGWVDSNGFPPDMIRYALKKLVARGVPKLSTSGSSTPAGPIVEIEVDRQRIEYADSLVGSKAWSVSQDPEVDQIIAMHRAPPVVRAPRTVGKRFVGRHVVI